MKYTIAVPTYNNSSTLEMTLKSVLKQSYHEDYEVLVVDNCSTDKTAEILGKYKDKISLVTNDFTVSLYENHNICVEKAKGDYIIFCHSDDELLPDALSKYHDVLKKRNFPDKYVVWGRSMFRDYYRHINRENYNLNETLSGISVLKVFQGGLTPSGTCYSRESFLKEGGFINVNHWLAAGDLVTLWKLLVSFFEFEMSDRIFFKRTNAGTAKDFTKKDFKDSLDDAFLNLFEDINSLDQKQILRYILNNSFNNKGIIKSLYRVKKIKQKDYLLKMAKINLRLVIGRSK